MQTPGGRPEPSSTPVVVVGIDLSLPDEPGSAVLLHTAQRWAREHAARLRVVRAWEPPGTVETDIGARDVLARETEQATARWVADHLGRNDVVDVEVVCVQGPAGPVLVEHSDGAALLVLGHGPVDGAPPAGSVGGYCHEFARCAVRSVTQVVRLPSPPEQRRAETVTVRESANRS